MSDVDTSAFSWHELLSQETTSGGAEPVQWVVVTKTPGILPAQIIADSLIHAGIPARAWQEGAGQAFGFTVGRLGDGHVVVPQTYEQQARDFLDSLDDLEEE